MIDHIGFTVSNLDLSRTFYDRAFAPLGIRLLMEVTEEMTGGHGAHLGFGRDENPFFWIGTGKAPSTNVHVAVSANDRAAVEAFYTAAINAGGQDNGGPGLRPHYSPDYYAAFVLDPDGNNIEAVFHGGFTS
ncbi:VOC family protein [Paracoccus sp. 11-3]|uniref:VOC family protein n=1 Tax=Paracoccus amoyensis TaxID=2760093 RepID=A0A926GH82_9RHOB|nr:VOC family protein [Paracoccus amoyensis]MBC9248596.1 VOC family protein [Paracoccus amoyensis]